MRIWVRVYSCCWKMKGMMIRRRRRRMMIVMMMRMRIRTCGSVYSC